MLVLSVKDLPGKRSHKVKVRFEGGVDLCLYKKECSRFGIEEGIDFLEEDYERLLSEVLIPRAKRRAMHLLEKQDRTRANLSQKLFESGYPYEAIEEALSYVESYHYIDDSRYAKNYVRYHQDRKSKKKIYEDLLKKGISKELILAAIEEEYFASEEEMILTLLDKRHYDLKTADFKEKSKMYRFLLGRGFRADDIDRILSKR